MISMKIKKMSKKDDHVMETKIQREKFGTTIDDILAEEAKKFDLSIEEFLESPKTARNERSLKNHLVRNRNQNRCRMFGPM